MNTLEDRSRMREVSLVKNTVKGLDDQTESVNLLFMLTQGEFYLKP
jgi:hypothetical protein